MRQLTALDAQFLNAESATTCAHVAGLAVLDPLGGVLDRAALAAVLLQRMHLSPVLGLRLSEVPFGLDHPYWEADPDFDLAHHLFEAEVAAPGGEYQLAEAVARIHARPLNRERPLWEMHLLSGLSGGRVAVYTKVHHAAIDGVSGAETLAALLDLTPEPRVIEVAPPPVERAPGLMGKLYGAAVRTATQPLRALGSLARMTTELDAVPLAGTLPGSRQLAKAARFVAGDRRTRPEVPSLHAPRTPFNGPISAERRVSFGSVPLKDVKQVAKAHGLSVNDVVMAVCAGALRAWLVERDALPEEPLIAAVPVAVRGTNSTGDSGGSSSARGTGSTGGNTDSTGDGTSAGGGTLRTDGTGGGASTGGGTDRTDGTGGGTSAGGVVGNRIAAMVAPMATDVADPHERLRATGAAMRAAKRRFVASSSSWLHDVSALLPAPVARLALPAAFRLAGTAFPPINLIVSNVPGPQFPLYLCGARVLSYYPLSVLTDLTGGVNITCFSYDGMIDFGVVACPERMDDVWSLVRHLGAALEELLDE
ncbi:WS/DGAT/MGAT family O-acyltransferase [Nonomuraea typhae]|uniref:WS/DGAT/MGAT family O-acyltransferase n=1 Tax=Nonomuraea typhae TaxID=2603600 RepID=UPI001FE88041|nr:wax ester/triacylglycerol synthase family O-acyltransferase [Nonomuraea typhae]